MNDAGRIGFVIRGDYNETETYDFLDLVYFEGASYVAKKETMGNEPVHNNEYWHIFSTDVNTLQPSFTQSEFREDIQSGDFLHIIFGKIKRWFTDLKDVAFTGNYDDLNNTPTSLKNPNALNIKFNGTSQTNYDGSVAQEIDVTPSSISAVNTSTVLNTIEEIDANTSNSNVAGAQALKAVKDQINSNLDSMLSTKANTNNIPRGFRDMYASMWNDYIGDADNADFGLQLVGPIKGQVGDLWYCLTFYENSNNSKLYGVQLAMRRYPEPVVLFRNKNNGTWSTWKSL